jgi:hypothetical protein
MFTVFALALSAVILWFADRGNESDRKSYDQLTVEERLQRLALHSRQDLKTIVFLLGGIMVLLGIIEDRI